jgi:hypothetical protein
MVVLTDIRTAIPLAGSLVLYFYFKPTLTPELLFFFFAFWGFCFALDMKVTVTNAKLMRHEKNLVFPILFYRFGPKISPLIQLIIEVIVILFVVNMFEDKLNLASISVVSFILGLAHLDGYLSNVRIIKKIVKD